MSEPTESQTSPSEANHVVVIARILRVILPVIVLAAGWFFQSLNKTGSTRAPNFLSVFGMLALAGVVVNDSLVMADF